MMFTTSKKDKKQRQFRTKKIGLESNDEQKTQTPSTSQQDKTESEIPPEKENNKSTNYAQEISETKKEVSSAPPQKKKLSLLSFNEEEDNEEFKLRKSTLSRKLSKQKAEKERPFQSGDSHLLEANDKRTATTVATDEYTPERIAELKQKTMTVDNAMTKSNEEVTDNSIDSTEGPQSATSTAHGNEVQKKSIPSASTTTPLQRKDDEVIVVLKSNRNPITSTSNVGTPQREFIVPTEAQIASIKAKRERLRRIGVTPEFISLQTSENDLNEKSDSEEESRLVRETSDDEDDEVYPDNVGSRLKFGVPEKEKPLKKTLYEVLEEGDEDENEFRQWELEQLKKSGLKRTQIQNIPLGIKGAVYEGVHGVSSKPTVRRTLEPLSVSDITKRLKESLSQMQSIHSQNKQRLFKIQTELQESRENIEKIDKEFKEASEQFNYFQEMKGYVLDLADCLQEKIPIVLEIEKKLEEAQINLATTIRRRNYQYLQDELEDVKEILGYPRPAGSNSDEQKKRREEREEMRHRKREARKYSKIEEPEGYSSDEQETLTERANFESIKQDLIKRANAVFEDVYEDFASIEHIKERFELWKRKYPESYKQAFTSIPLRDILAPFIRIELLQWDPLSNPQLDAMHWHQVLLNYGLGPQQQDYDENDEDSQLIPALVEKVVFPKVKTLLAMMWNPTSRTQNLQGIELIKEMSEFVGAEKLKDLLVQVHLSLQSAAESIVMLTPSSHNPEEVLAFCRRQFWFTLKSLRNFALWSDYFPQATLEKLIVDNLINSKLLPYVRVLPSLPDTLEHCEHIVQSLPRAWFINAKVPPPSLAVLHEFISNRVVKQLEEKVRENRDPKSIRLLTRGLNLLSNLSDFESVQRIAAKNKINLVTESNNQT